MSIAEVITFLDELMNRPDKPGVLREIIRRTTAEEFKWFCRIILKDLKVGLGHEIVLKYFHEDALEYYNVTSSLKEVCKEFEDKNHKLKNVLRLFHPIKPMLAAKRTLDDIMKIMENKNFLIETKFDGERI